MRFNGGLLFLSVKSPKEKRVNLSMFYYKSLFYSRMFFLSPGRTIRARNEVNQALIAPSHGAYIKWSFSKVCARVWLFDLFNAFV